MGADTVETGSWKAASWKAPTIWPRTCHPRLPDVARMRQHTAGDKWPRTSLPRLVLAVQLCDLVERHAVLLELGEGLGNLAVLFAQNVPHLDLVGGL